MDLKEIKEEFGDCDWMRALLNGYAVDAILWLMNKVEESEQCVKEQECIHRLAKDMMKPEHDSIILFKSRNEKWLEKERSLSLVH